MKLFDFVTRKIEKEKSKRSLHDYGYQVKTFDLPLDGKIEYAQWQHPYEQPKTISQDMVNFFRAYSRAGGTAIDIGAHSGDTTIPMALAVGPSGTVLALEPNPHVFSILQKNSELNKGKASIIPLCFAATDHDGEFEFNYSDASYCNGGFFQSLKNQKHGHTHILKVQGKNLEAYLKKEYAGLLPGLSLIKIDAEGYDKEIIKSLRNLILEHRPYIISECNKNLVAEERADLFHVISGMNYTVKKLEGFTDKAKPSDINHAGEMTKWQHFDLVAIPG
jgi:FkbM family methyltransferase